MKIETILEHSLSLRRQKQYDQAFKYVTESISPESPYAYLIWQHNPIFWSDISTKACVLTRRNSEDHAFIRDIFSVPGFVRSFNRNAQPLPSSTAHLQQILDDEMISFL